MHHKGTVAFLAFGAVLATGLMVVGRGAPFGEWFDGEFQLNPQAPRVATFVLDCTAEARPISPLIYGIGGHVEAWSMGVTARRHGGNPTSRYNWELDTYNAGNDWYFKNAGGAAPRKRARALSGREPSPRRQVGSHAADARLGREGRDIVLVPGIRLWAAEGDGAGAAGRREWHRS